MIVKVVVDLAVPHLALDAQGVQDVLEDVEDAREAVEDRAQPIVGLIVLQTVKEVVKILVKQHALQHAIPIVQVHATVKQLKI